MSINWRRGLSPPTYIVGPIAPLAQSAALIGVKNYRAVLMHHREIFIHKNKSRK